MQFSFSNSTTNSCYILEVEVDVMSKIDKIEKELKEFHKQLLAEYIAKAIETTHRVYKKDDLECYKFFYNSSGDTFIYSEKEQEEIYNLVDSILTNKYSLLVANDAFVDNHIYLVDLRWEV